MKETWHRDIVWWAIVGFIPFVSFWTHTHGISVAAKCLKFIMCHFSKLKKLEIKSQIQIHLLPSCTIYNGWQRFPQNPLLTLFWQLISASSPFKPGLNSVNLPIFVHKNVTSLLHYYIFEDAQVNEASIWKYWANFLVQHDQSWIGSMFFQYALYKCSKFWIIPPNLQSPIPEPEGQKQSKGGHRKAVVNSPTVLWVFTIWNSVIGSLLPGSRGLLSALFYRVKFLQNCHIDEPSRHPDRIKYFEIWMFPKIVGFPPKSSIHPF